MWDGAIELRNRAIANPQTTWVRQSNHVITASRQFGTTNLSVPNCPSTQQQPRAKPASSIHNAGRPYQPIDQPWLWLGRISDHFGNFFPAKLLPPLKMSYVTRRALSTLIPPKVRIDGSTRIFLLLQANQALNRLPLHRFVTITLLPGAKRDRTGREHRSTERRVECDQANES